MSDASSQLLTPASRALGLELRVRGLVQGVGFRPTVWRLAHRFHLAGEVLNDGAGVLIRAWGSREDIDGFESALQREPPPLARIDRIERRTLAGPPPSADFRITASEGGAVSTGIVPDAATCPDCLAETLDPRSRRYRYPFTNCTHCGPRLSIVRAIPYDRATTSMAPFHMCEDCRAEYDNPADRRFHAEPIACPACGPRVWLADQSGATLPIREGHDAIFEAAALIAGGKILAIKGIGGFHLACDAANGESVARLRSLKRRSGKPFALLALDVAMIRRSASVSAPEEQLLSSPAAPIVVLGMREDASLAAQALAPGQNTLGFMLPYTPLHHLLLRDIGRPIVLTSGNVSDEPQCTTNDAARTRLAQIADVWLMHDREIVNRLDDSVVRIAAGAQATLRRARGYAPEPMLLPEGFAGAPRVLALGAELKSTFCLARGGSAILSQHIGDLEDSATHGDFREALDLYRRIFDFDPDIIAVDCHPDYLSTQWGAVLAAETGARLLSVQHHHAHVTATLAEHGVPLSAPPVLGIVLDGLGLAETGELWGGEFLLADYLSYERLASFAPVPLIGGNRAMREPWRNAFAHLHIARGWQEISRRHARLDIVRLIEARQPAVLAGMLERGVNAPPASSAGRLFDAAAAMIGLHPEQVSYEGQAAIELEACAAPVISSLEAGYPAEATEGAPLRLSWGLLWDALLDDLENGTAPGLMAARFHRGVIDAIAGLALRLCQARNIRMAVLSGGVMQNRLLLEGLSAAIAAHGIAVLMPQRVPANDGGISFGQAAAAMARAVDATRTATG